MQTWITPLNAKPIILLLDDSEQRHEMFRTAAWDLDIEHTYSIPGFRQSVLERERPPDIISLDHDLEGVYHISLVRASSILICPSVFHLCFIRV